MNSINYQLNEERFLKLQNGGTTTFQHEVHDPSQFKVGTTKLADFQGSTYILLITETEVVEARANYFPILKITMKLVQKDDQLRSALG